jgi:hypothetical protein
MTCMTSEAGMGERLSGCRERAARRLDFFDNENPLVGFEVVLTCTFVTWYRYCPHGVPGEPD